MTQVVNIALAQFLILSPPFAVGIVRPDTCILLKAVAIRGVQS